VIKEVIRLFIKDFSLEWRHQERLAGIFLYLFSCILVLYYSLTRVERFMWVPVFWILIIFLSINALTSSFTRDIKARQWYLYTLCHPLSVYFAKLLFNFLSLFLFSCISLVMMKVFFDLPITDWSIFIKTLIICILGISIVFTFVALISAKAGDQSTLMSILAMPLIFPLMMSGSRLMLHSLGILQSSRMAVEYLSLIAIDALALGLSIVLFPILWRD
jgi:heme exporter protein B